MARVKQTRKNMHYFLIDVGGRKPIRIGVKARNAVQKVVLSRNLSDVLKGKQKGLAITCANALCALRANGTAFPHDAFMAEFTDNRAYIVDKLDSRGVPKSCVVYTHEEGSFQKEFDTTPKGRLSKMSGVEKLFILSPPKPITPAGKGTSHNRDHSGTPGATRARRKAVLHKGAVARALRQGIELVPSKKRDAVAS